MTRVQRGDVWLLGDHRLLCGDATNPHDVARLMDGERPTLGLHDPPYGLNIVRSTRIHRNRFMPMHGDNRPFDPSHLLGTGTTLVLWGANHYADKLPPSGCWIVWDKRVDLPSNTFADAELAWCSDHTNVARILRHRWFGAIKDSERGQPCLHPTQKPVAIQQEIIERASNPGELVADWYAGSGTTLIAAERTNRRCYSMEIDPGYCATIIARWEAETGYIAGVERMFEGAA